jgi:hypothetical protein
MHPGIELRRDDRVALLRRLHELHLVVVNSVVMLSTASVSED